MIKQHLTGVIVIVLIMDGEEAVGALGTVPEFRFLTNHGNALLLIARDPRIRIRDIAALLDIPERARLSVSLPIWSNPGTSTANGKAGGTSTA